MDFYIKYFIAVSEISYMKCPIHKRYNGHFLCSKYLSLLKAKTACNILGLLNKRELRIIYWKSCNCGFRSKIKRNKK